MPKHTKSQNSDPGIALLNKIFGDIASSPLAVRRCQRATNKQINQPEERVKHHLERLEEAIKRPRRDMDGEVRQERLQRALVNKATINLQDEALVEKIARGIFASEKKATQERGEGQGAEGAQPNFEKVKDDYIKLVHEKRSLQLSSLSRWTEYLLKNDAQHPPWFRYLAIRGALKMGDIDRDAPKFAHRSKDTTAPFPELNAEALGFVFKALSNHSDPSLLENIEEKLTLPLRTALAANNFSALYAVALVACNQTIDRSRLEGEWRKYDQFSEHTILERDLSGKGTGWCTATGSASGHLKGGDFYVFYTKNEKGECTVPRLAIRMDNDRIIEIRGIAPGQEVEPEFVEVAKKMGMTLPGYEEFKKAFAEMKRMTEIDKSCFRRDAAGKFAERLEPKPLFSKDDLRFLYEIDSKISSFGYEQDPRIEEILQTRSDKLADYAQMYEVERDQVVTDKRDITSSTRVYIGDLVGPEDCQLLNGRNEPIIIAGKAHFRDCTSLNSIPEGIVFNANADFRGCTSLTAISKGVVFKSGANFKGCTFLTVISEGSVFNGYVGFEGCISLTSISEGVMFNGEADFKGCTALTVYPAGMRPHKI